MITPLNDYVMSVHDEALNGVPRGILRVFNTILYENELQNPQIFQQTISLFPGGRGGCGGSF
jgi:hypothetical protein